MVTAKSEVWVPHSRFLHFPILLEDEGRQASKNLGVCSLGPLSMSKTFMTWIQFPFPHPAFLRSIYHHPIYSQVSQMVSSIQTLSTKLGTRKQKQHDSPNTGNNLPYYMVSHPIRPLSQYSAPVRTSGLVCCIAMRSSAPIPGTMLPGSQNFVPWHLICHT